MSTRHCAMTVRWSAAIATAGAMLLQGCAAHAPRQGLAVPAGLPAQVDLGATPFFPQREYQCGPAALATVLTASGVLVRPDQLVPEVYLPARGGSLQAELVAATRQRDRLAYVVPPSLPSLLAQLAAGDPVLVLQKTGGGPWPGWHYAVVIGYDAASGRLLLRSGAKPRLELSVAQFLATWDRAGRWALVAVEPGRVPAAADFDAYMQAAAGLEAVGRPDSAALAYRSAAAAWPEAPLPRLGLANLAFARGDLAAAERELRVAALRSPGDVAVRNNRAAVLLAMGCVASARLETEAATTLAAGSSHAGAVAATRREIAATHGGDGAGCPPDATSADSGP
jgi:predicted double-glycine peptidase